MDENAVVDAVCRKFHGLGYRIEQRCSTTERGIDIIALDPSTGRRYLVEAKGGTSSREGSARFGNPYTQSQVFDRVAKGIFTCLQLRAANPDQNQHQVLLAVPDSRWFRSYLEPVMKELDDVGIKVWFIEASQEAARG